ncbi:MAG: DUF937 domain-containing protein [Neomegalonema sp.]|nr:DUF937 domain-containing protein [Neomegalonema sp.]
MNMMEMLASAQGGQGIQALANKFGITPEQAQQVASQVLPAVSSGVKQKAQSPEGLQQLAGFLRSNDAAAAHESLDADTEAAEVQGQQFLEGIFGGQSGAIADAVANEAAPKVGLDTGTIMAMLPTITSMVLGGMQKRESADSGLNNIIGSVLSGDSGNLGAIMGMLGGGASSGSSGGGLLGSVMGMLGGGAKSAPASADKGGLDSLLGMFDADGDGSVADDLLARVLK